MKQKTCLLFAAISGAVAVILGAFAAHSLKKYVDEDALKIFDTAVKYQFYHTLALLSAGILWPYINQKFLAWGGIFFMTGIILFSGSLYFLSTAEIIFRTQLQWIGFITPLGGICLITGWILLFVSVAKTKMN